MKGVAALFKRKENEWKWIEHGELNRYPRLGEVIMVRHNATSFAFTEAISQIISINETEPNALEIVFQDQSSVWKLVLPAHSHNIADVTRQILKEEK